ncbi:MAG: aminopeptidase P family protein [Alphaproteobacteria bacterium]
MTTELDIAPANKAQADERLAALRAEMKAQRLDGFLVPRSDEYQNEYAPPASMRLAWITGFTGSAGFAVVQQDNAAFFTDSRYTVQAAAQLDPSVWTCLQAPPNSVSAFLGDLPEGLTLGYDPCLHTVNELKPLLKAHAGLRAVDQNPLDKVWADQPDWPITPCVPHPIEFAGEDSESKRSRLAASLNTDAALITSPASIAWLLNMRGADVACTPLPLSTVILHKSGHVDLFIHPDKANDALDAHLGNQVTRHDEAALAAALAGLKDKSVLLDPAQSADAYRIQLENAGANVTLGHDPCTLPKACKNAVEIEGTHKAHIRDGLALTKFLYWLSIEAPKGQVDELQAATKLTGFRQETGVLKDLSFDVISASGANAALPHYRVTEATNRKLQPGDVYLVDSGGQYLDGTTDVTRTIMIGPRDPIIADRFTRVLKGMISLSMARFPEGTTGTALDAFARQSLWAGGLDFGHGTGHGVGSYLGVHEGPQGISPRAQEPLRPGMIVSNEPGYYLEGAFGIRIENLVVVTPPQDIRDGETPMLGFDTLTFAPIDRTLILADMLSLDEREWLNAYHAQVYDLYADDLDEQARAWLKNVTAEI